jgi:hypothetical protein
LTKKPEDHLPAKAPKRTGKKGIGPLDEKQAEEFALKPDPPAEKKKPELLSEANKKRGKTTRLPGMEDAEIEALEDAAKEYANVRDDRMNLTREESSLKETLLELMKKHKKEVYRHDGVEVKIVHEEETVRVKILKDKED